MAYAPPTFDEATGMMAEPAMEANVMQVGLNPAPRQGVSRGSGDAYAQLADDDEDDALATRERHRPGAPAGARERVQAPDGGRGGVRAELAPADVERRGARGAPRRGHGPESGHGGAVG